MSNSKEMLEKLSEQYRQQYRQQEVILTFEGYLSKLREAPRRLIRNAPSYLKDTFDYFGLKETFGKEKASVRRFNLFDLGTEKNGPIIGCEAVQDEIYSILESFVRQGHSNKLILLHGPNGSAKSSMLEAVSHAMGRYSEMDIGAVYRFNWIFPTEKSEKMRVHGEVGPIGFGDGRDRDNGTSHSFALLEEAKIASRIHSEFKDNPVYLLPMPQREIWLRQWISESEGCRPEDVELPKHVLYSGLSKKNQLILENLLTVYDGDLSRVMRHVQVERFYYSRQYRVGIASVEPQMSIDAIEKQLTMDSNIQNLPAVLHNIRFHEAHGPLIEANRGLLEFSDMLKRPVEAFKYLLTTVEKAVIDLPSSTANLDVVFFGTTNEKHLDAFKTLPDFASFRSRFELVTVPYLLTAREEERIYDRDVKAIGKLVKITPHSLRLLCIWAVMTRLKQPDPEYYDSKHRALIARLDPRSKLGLYEGESLKRQFTSAEETVLRELRSKIIDESRGVLIYEGRFGASPREIRGLLHRAAQNPKFPTLTPMAIFAELDRLIKDRTVYEFLQFEPRGKYHDAAAFIKVIKDEFVRIFENEVVRSMTLVEQAEYDALLQRYVDNVVAFVKKEKIYNSGTGSYEAPNENVMKEVERVLGVSGSVDRHREGMLGRIAAWKLDHRNEVVDVKVVFDDVMRKIEDHYHAEKKKLVDANFRAMLLLDGEEERNLKELERDLARTTYEQLEKRFGYDKASARECLKFIMTFKQG